MKELAEQAATGTYNSTQRLMIYSEYTQMALEINRIADATNFNGINLLDGSCAKKHNGKNLDSTGQIKVHFGPNNDAREDYYYIGIADAHINNLFNGEADLGVEDNNTISEEGSTSVSFERLGQYYVTYDPSITVNDCDLNQDTADTRIIKMTDTGFPDINDIARLTNNQWYSGYDKDEKPYSGFGIHIPNGTKNILINTYAGGMNFEADNDIQLYTASGIHLAGTLPNDYVFKEAYAHKNTHRQPASPNEYENLLGFDPKTHQNSYLNSGPTYYNSYGTLLNYTSYNGMIIGYTGDSDQFDSKRNNGIAEKWIDYEILTISEAKEDLILWYPGNVSGAFKVYVNATLPDISSIEKDTSSPDPLLYLPPIDTQELAQAALNSLDKAIVKKDKIRANLGALQNRFENTITNLTTQAENLLASESRISDVDIATEMTNFVRNQILTQSAVAMLSQANTVPQMALQIIGS